MSALAESQVRRDIFAVEHKLVWVRKHAGISISGRISHGDRELGRYILTLELDRANCGSCESSIRGVEADELLKCGGKE